MEPKAIERVLKLARKYGLISLKMDGIEFSLDPTHIPPRNRPERLLEGKESKTEERDYTDEEIALWSSGSGF